MSQILLQSLDFLSVGTPSVGDFILGVDIDGIPKLKRNTDTIPLYSTGSTNYYHTNFYDFNDMINTNSLIGGSIYVITDFQTRHYIQYTDSAGDGTSMDEIINTSFTTESLVVLALSDNTYDSNVKSLAYPDDEIIWKHDLADREFDYANPVGIGTGHIVYRKSINGNSRDYDFRNVVFRRWNDGLGNYTVVMKSEAPNAFDFIDYKSFEEGYQVFRKNEIGSIGTLSNGLGIPYYLDNLIITTQSIAYGNYISVAHGVTIDVGDFSENRINLTILSNFINPSASINFNQFDTVQLSNFFGDVSFNQSKIINSSTFSGGFVGNIIVNVDASILGSAYSNKFTTVESCVIDNIYNNLGDSISFSNITTLSSNDINSIVSCTCSTIDSNICNYIQNTQAVEIYNNIVDLIQDNVIGGGIYGNVGGAITNNSGSLVNINGNKFITLSGNTGTGSIHGNTSKIIVNNSIDGDIYENAVAEIEGNTNTGSITGNIGISITYNTCGAIEYNNIMEILNNISGDYANNVGDLITGNTFNLCESNNVYVIEGNNLDQANNNQGYSISFNIGPSAVINSNNVYLIFENTISNEISSNIGGVIQDNVSDYIYQNTSGDISNNYCSLINNNTVNSMDSNTASSIGYNNVSLLLGNIVSDLSYNTGFIVSNNLGGTVSFNSTQYISDNINITEMTSNKGAAISDNNTPFINNNDVHHIQSNTASNIFSNKSHSISYNWDVSGNGGVIGTNSVHTIEGNISFSDIGGNTGVAITNNTFNASYSTIFGNISTLITDNTNSKINGNTSEAIYNNRVSIIKGNNIFAILNNYNLYSINGSDGKSIDGATGSTGSYYIQLDHLKNVELYQVILNGNIKRHTFIDDISNLSLTPSTDMQSTSYPTVSRYLFDLGGYYEEKANSTGLTYSGPIA